MAPVYPALFRSGYDIPAKLAVPVAMVTGGDQARDGPAPPSRRIETADAPQLRATETARRRVIDVDDFAKDELPLSQGKVR
ncbi:MULTISPECIES: hypothetical protein [Pseudomonas]|uniref:hypothetical protein n=1 Tax=Pseudomonadaceae TaxID=135621 RepID=UPI0010F9B61D|nr:MULTISPECIES: hypothetical protein [Pseudomonas]MDE3736114.1 hypothetical protein [Pseudomonas resinovorans]